MITFYCIIINIIKGPDHKYRTVKIINYCPSRNSRFWFKTRLQDFFDGRRSAPTSRIEKIRERSIGPKDAVSGLTISDVLGRGHNFLSAIMNERSVIIVHFFYSWPPGLSIPFLCGQIEGFHSFWWVRNPLRGGILEKLPLLVQCSWSCLFQGKNLTRKACIW